MEKYFEARKNWKIVCRVLATGRVFKTSNDFQKLGTDFKVIWEKWYHFNGNEYHDSDNGAYFFHKNIV